MRRECRERLPPPPRVSDPDMHHGTCVTHVPWCMPGSLLSNFRWSRWRGKRSRHSRRMRNTSSYVSGKMAYSNPSIMAVSNARYLHKHVSLCIQGTVYAIWLAQFSLPQFLLTISRCHIGAEKTGSAKDKVKIVSILRPNIPRCCTTSWYIGSQYRYSDRGKHITMCAEYRNMAPKTKASLPGTWPKAVGSQTWTNWQTERSLVYFEDMVSNRISFEVQTFHSKDCVWKCRLPK